MEVSFLAEAIWGANLVSAEALMAVLVAVLVGFVDLVVVAVDFLAGAALVVAGTEIQTAAARRRVPIAFTMEDIAFLFVFTV